MHVVHEALPLTEENDPPGPGVQVVAPCFEYSPGAHVSQVSPLIQDPAGHGLQVPGSLPQSGKVLAGQGVTHEVLPQAGTVPFGHTVQEVAPGPVFQAPSGQGSHDRLPLRVEYVPPGQYAQVVAACPEYSPGAHVSQDSLLLLLHDPAGQAMQGLERLSPPG